MNRCLRIIRKDVIKCMTLFQFSLNFDEKNTENTMSPWYFNEESNYSEKNTCGTSLSLQHLLT